MITKLYYIYRLNKPFKRGVFHLGDRQFTTAITDFDTAIEFYPTHAEAWFCRGVAYGNKSDWNSAIADFDRTIELKPEFADAWFNRGLAYYLRRNSHFTTFISSITGDLDKHEMIELMNEIGPINPHGTTYICPITDDLIEHEMIKLKNEMDLDISDGLKTIVNKLKDDVDHSISDFSRAIELNRTHSNAWFYRGIAWYTKGELDQAISNFSTAIELNPSDADTWYVRSIAYRDKNEMDRAIADFDRFKAIGANCVSRINLTAYQSDQMSSAALGRDLMSEFAIRNYDIEMFRPAFAEYENTKLLMRTIPIINSIPFCVFYALLLLLAYCSR